MDAITLLKQDHRTVEELFQRFEQASDRAIKAKRQVADRIIKELSIHAVIEEQLLYPAAREKDEELAGLVLRSLEEHHIVKWSLSELEKMDIEDERFTAKMLVLIENVRQHVKEEERELLPRFKRALNREELDALGENLQLSKKSAPTHPHPRSPDQPPGNLAAGVVAKVLDTGRDILRGSKGRVTRVSAKQRRQRRKR